MFLSSKMTQWEHRKQEECLFSNKRSNSQLGDFDLHFEDCVHHPSNLAPY